MISRLHLLEALRHGVFVAPGFATPVIARKLLAAHNNVLLQRRKASVSARRGNLTRVGLKYIFSVMDFCGRFYHV